MHLSYITQPWLDDLVLAHIEHAKGVIGRGVTRYASELILHEDVEGEMKTTLCLLDGVINPGEYGPMLLLGQRFAQERRNICAVTGVTCGRGWVKTENIVPRGGSFCDPNCSNCGGHGGAGQDRSCGSCWDIQDNPRYGRAE